MAPDATGEREHREDALVHASQGLAAHEALERLM
jgi:hypothetical protein